MSKIIEIQTEINKELANKEVFNSLITTTFKGVDQSLVKRAMMEGMMRGFKFNDFLEKNIYAIPFNGRHGSGYSLVTSIDYSRKIGMRSGICGKSAPIFTEKTDKIETCSVTVKRLSGGYVGEYTATVYFDEYNTGRNLWQTKPHTMIAKVAEMHALRMACPEELSQSYIEEEFEKEIPVKVEVNTDQYLEKLEKVSSLDELKTIWASMPIEAKNQLKDVKNAIKKRYENNNI